MGLSFDDDGAEMTHDERKLDFEAKFLFLDSACKKNAFLLLFFTRSVFFTNPDFEYFRVKNL